jgi:hypothetical protein
MSSVFDFYWRVYAWISSAPLPLLVVLTVILLVTVPAATNALVAAALAIIRGGVRLLRRGGHPRQLSSPLRHTPSQLVSLILLLSWAS